MTTEEKEQTWRDVLDLTDGRCSTGERWQKVMYRLACMYAEQKAALAASEAARERAERRVREMEDEPLEFGAFPDDASDRDVLLYVADCASRWAPGVRLLGNARARDVARACINAAATLDAPATGEVGG
jgi:hypothetical protein